jgi:hypothetical protein
VSTQDIIRDIRAIRLAEDQVRPVVGDVGACGSPGMVYKKALKALGHDVSQITGAAAAAMWPTVRHQPRKAASLAMDTKTERDMTARFPHVNSLKLR